jgi:hypothetical protein
LKRTRLWNVPSVSYQPLILLRSCHNTKHASSCPQAGFQILLTP